MKKPTTNLAIAIALTMLAVIITLVGSCAIHAQDIDTTYVSPEEVQVIGWADDSAPLSITNLQSGELRAFNRGQDASQVLSYTPSIQYYSDSGNPFIGYNYYRLRGIDQTRISTSLNGIPLNEPEDMGVYFGNFPDFLSSVSSVQIQRGAGQSFFGSPSYAGNINFVINPAGRNKEGSLELSGGSWGSHRSSGYYSWKQGFARGSYLSTNGYRDGAWTDSYSLFTGQRLGNWNIVAFGGTQSNGMAYLATSESDLDSNRKLNYLGADEDDTFSQIHVQAINHINKNKSLGLFYTRLWGNYDIDFGDPNLYNYRLSSHWVGALYTGRTESRGLEWGSNVDLYFREHSLWAPQELYNNLGTKLQSVIYLTKETQLGREVVMTNRISARIVSFIYTDDDLDETWDWTFLNPSTGLSWNNLWIGAALTFREPTRSDLFGGFDDLTGDNIETLVSIDPERVLDIEGGWKGRNLDVTLFWMEFRNEIAPIGELSSIGLPLRKNVDKSYRRGVEIEGQFNYIGGNIALMDAQIETYRDDNTGVTFNNVTPLLTPSLTGNVFLTKWNSYLGARFVSESELTNTNGKDLPGHISVWLKAQKTLGDFTLSVNIDNLLDSEYFLSGYQVGDQRHFFVGASRTIMIGGSYGFH